MSAEYLRCVGEFIKPFDYAEVLERQLSRRDLDTVCAYELYNMKKYYNETPILNMSSFIPDHKQ